MIGYFTIYSGYYDSWYRSMIRMANHASHQAFLAKKLRSARSRFNIEQQRLTSMGLTAVNAHQLKVPIRQPCWRAGRWKSLT